MKKQPGEGRTTRSEDLIYALCIRVLFGTFTAAFFVAALSHAQWVGVAAASSHLRLELRLTGSKPSSMS